MVVATGQVDRTHGVGRAPWTWPSGPPRACLEAAPGLASQIEQVSVVNIMSGAGPAPAAALARRLGLTPARTEVTTIGGNSPQWLVSRAASAIAAGELDSALVVGAEAQHSAKAAAGGYGPTAGAPTTADVTGTVESPTRWWATTASGVGAAELAAGLLAPVHVYALFESVIAQRAGRSLADQRTALGRAHGPVHRGGRRTTPTRGSPRSRTPAELATRDADNRLVAEPYPKRMCAFLHVDQARRCS